MTEISGSMLKLHLRLHPRDPWRHCGERS